MAVQKNRKTRSKRGMRRSHDALTTAEETQTWLNCHYKFISVKNIILLFISSDDFTP